MIAQFYRNSLGSRIFDVSIIMILCFFAILTLYPLIYTITLSLQEANVLNNNFYLWPEKFTINAYRGILKDRIFWKCYFNTIFYVMSNVLVCLTLTLTTAYPLTVRDFPLRNFLMFFITFTMLFSGGLIPYYLLIKRLGFVNTIWVMIIPGALSAYYVILTRTFIQSSIPISLREAAMLDGANEFFIFSKIILPLSKPIIAVIALFQAVGVWNNWFTPMIFLSDRKLFPVALYLQEIVVGSLQQTQQLTAELKATVSPTSVRCATLIVVIVPIMCVYPFLQKYFVKGVMIGAIKE